MRTLVSLLGLLLLTACAQTVPIPDGYRMYQYKAPVPSHVPGATTITTATARTFFEQGSARFIDVIGAGKFLTKGIDDEWLEVTPRHSIPGSIWLPDVGRGALTATQADYFTRSMADLSGGKRDSAFVFFCLADCWMSWNATKRALEMGYTNIYWLPTGSDGWAAAGYALKPISPRPVD